MTPRLVLAVAAGGALGSVARYISMAVIGRWAGTAFPWGTLFVNLGGSLVIGILAGLATWKLDFPEPWRVFLFVGVMGGFTTFSTFSLDMVTLLQKNMILAALYAAGSLVLGVGCLFAGLGLVRWLTGGLPG